MSLTKATSMFERFARLQQKMRNARRRPRKIERLSQEAAAYGRDNQVAMADLTERSLLLEGRLAANLLPDKIEDLSEAEFRVSSQWGEDGIIEWLLRHVVPPNNRFIEFGVENFREANCRFLLQHRNWRGLVLDSSEEHMSALRKESLFYRHDLAARTSFITRENINDLIVDEGFAGPLGILSIDLDGIDYWVWDNIECIQPAIVLCEYNPIMGDLLPISIPYDPAFRRFHVDCSGLYFGCSIAALRNLAERKGYAFVGTSSNGINAFFVRNELAESALCHIRRVKAFPSRHRDSRDRDGRFTFVRGRNRLRLIEEHPVVDVRTGERTLLRDIAEPYSDEWLAGMD
jgi:hypothetical protein